MVLVAVVLVLLLKVVVLLLVLVVVVDVLVVDVVLHYFSTCTSSSGVLKRLPQSRSPTHSRTRPQNKNCFVIGIVIPIEIAISDFP